MRIIDCVQGSAEWFAARAGVATASEFATVMASGRGGGASLTRQKYLDDLAAEIITGEPTESFTNGAMERGKAMEPEARDAYAFLKDAVPQQVGFIVNDDERAGCSPDSLIGTNGALEIKTKKGGLLVGCLRRGTFPSEHRAQCQGVLWIAEREWIDLAVYWPRLPLFVIREYRDEDYIANLAREVARFNEELARTVEFVRSYGIEPARAAA